VPNQEFEPAEELDETAIPEQENSLEEGAQGDASKKRLWITGGTIFAVVLAFLFFVTQPSPTQTGNSTPTPIAANPLNVTNVSQAATPIPATTASTTSTPSSPGGKSVFTSGGGASGGTGGAGGASGSSSTSALITSQLSNIYNIFNKYIASTAALNSPAVLGTGTAKYWTGAVNTAWTTTGNWSPAGKPTSADDVIIENSSYGRYPVLTMSQSSGCAASQPNIINSLSVGVSSAAQITFGGDGVCTLYVNDTAVIGPSGAVLASGSLNRTVKIQAGNGITIQSGGYIYITNVSVQGGTGLGGSYNIGSGGSGHGGRGGNEIKLSDGSTVAAGGNTYDSDVSPTMDGTGSYVNGGWTYNAGGAVYLGSSSGPVILSGTIYVNGNTGVYTASGGSSGGSVWISAPAIQGTGSVLAQGGDGASNGTYYGGGGGGGRISISPNGGATPTISGISPNIGASTGGDVITISGTGFTSSSTVLIGSQSATVTYINSTTLHVTVPSTSQSGAVNVRVSNGMNFAGILNASGGSGGTAGGDGTIVLGSVTTATGGYTYYLVPTINSVSPTNSSVAGGGALIVGGTNFDTTSTISINGVAVTTTHTSSVSLSATIPAHAVGGPVDVSVTNSGISTATLSNALTYVPRLAFQSAALNVAQTQPGQVTVALRDGPGNSTTSTNDLTVNLTSTSGGGSFSVNASPWSAVTSIVIPAGQPMGSFYYRDSTKGTPTITITQAALSSLTATQQETITTKYRFRVTGISDPIQSGVPSSVTVQSVDFAGNPLTDFTGIVHFTSTDAAAILPADFTFTSAMLGIHTFVNAITMGTVGEFRVTATYTGDVNDTGYQDNITVTAPNAGTISKLVIITPPQSFATTSHSSGITVQAQDVTGAAIPVATAKTIYVYRTTTTGTFSLDGSTNYTNPGAITAAYSLIIPAHASSATLYYKDTTAGNPTLTFRDDAGNSNPDSGWVNATQTESVGAGLASKYLLSVASQPTTNQFVAVTATLADSNNVPVTALENTDAFFTRASSTGWFSLDSAGTNPVTSLAAAIPAGATGVTVYFMDTAYHTTTITVSDSAPPNGATGLLDATTNVVINPPFNKLVIISGPSIITATQSSSTYTVQAQDVLGNVVVMTAPFTAYPTSSSAGGTFATSSGGPWTATQLTIGTGSSTASFYYMDTAVGTPILTISDQTPLDIPDVGITNATKTITVNDMPPSQLAFTTSAQTVTSGAISGIITVQARKADNNPAILVSSLVVQLAASRTSGRTGTAKFVATADVNAAAITSVTIPAGSSSASYYYTDNGYGGRTITAASGALTTATQNWTVSSGPATKLIFTSSPQTIQAGYVSSQYTAVFQDSFGNQTSMSTQQSISLGSSCGTGSFSAAAPPSWVATALLSVPASTETFSFYYLDSAGGSCNLTIGDTGLTPATQLTIVSPPPSRIIFTSSPVSLVRGSAAAPLTIGLADIYGNLAPSPVSKIIYLTSTSPSGVFSRTSFTMPAGQVSASFTYVDTVLGAATLTAADQPGSTDTGFTDGTQIFTVVYGVPRGVTITPARATQNNGQRNHFTATLTNQYGYNTVADQDYPMVLDTSAHTGIFYASDNATALGDTPTVTVPTGAGSFDFWFGPAAVSTNITATITGLSPGSARLTVIPDAAYRLQIAGGGTGNFTSGQTANLSVQVTDVFGDLVPVTDPLIISLGTTSSTATMPATVTIPGGGASVSFSYTETAAGSATITAADFALPDSPDQGLVNATFVVNYSTGTATAISIRPQPTTFYTVDRVPVTISSVNSFGQPVSVGAATTVTLITNGTNGHFYATATSGTVITTTIIPLNQSSVIVYYRQTTASASSTLTATATGFTNGTSLIQVVATTAAKLTITMSASLVTNQSATVTVYMRNSANATTTETLPRTVYLGTSSGTATLGATTVIIPAGSSFITTTFSDTVPESVTVTAADRPLPDSPDLGLTNGTASVTITNGSIAKLGWENVPTSMVRGQVVQTQVSLQNQYGGDVPASVNQTAYLSSSSATGQFATNANGPWTTTSVVFPVGSSSVTVYYRDNTHLGTVNLTASDVSAPPETPDTGLTNGVVTLGEIAGVTTQLRFIAPPATVRATHPSDPLVLEAENQYGMPVPMVTNKLIYLDAGGLATNQFSASGTTGWGITQIFILIDQSRVNVYFRGQTEGPVTITASDLLPISPDTGWTNAVTSITVQRQILDHLLVTNISTPQQQGTPTSAVVVAEDAQNYPVAWYDGTVSFTSDDPGYTYLPDSYTFVSATDLGTHTFTNGVVFDRPGIKAVTVTDPVNHISGTQSGIVVLGASTNPVAALAFSSPPSPLALPSNVTSGPITLITEDSQGLPTVAGSGGLPVRITSTSAGGQFAANPTGPWLSVGNYTIPQGEAFVKFYYRDAVAGQATVTAADWQGGVDSPGITNAQLAVNVDFFTASVTPHIQSRDYTGTLISNQYLFATDELGHTGGRVSFDLAASSVTTHAPYAANWITDWQAGSTLLDHQTRTGSTGYTYTPADIVTTAGADPFEFHVSVSSAQQTTPVTSTTYVPVSPWTADVTAAGTHNIDHPLTVSVFTASGGALTDAYSGSISLLDAGGNPAGSAASLGIANHIGTGAYTVDLPVSVLAPGAGYHVLIILRDAQNNIVAEDLSNEIILTNIATPTPFPGPSKQLTGRSVTLGTSTPSDNTADFQWHSAVNNTIRSIRIQLCTTPIKNDPCTTPSGASMSSTTLTSTGGQLGAVGGWTYGINNAQDVLLTNATGAAVTIGSLQTVGLDGFINPSTYGTFFFRITTYSDVSGAANYSLEYGAVATSTAKSITTTADVGESLIFRVANTVSANCTSQTDVADPNNTTEDLVTLSPASLSLTNPSVATAQFCASTNAQYGYVISYHDEALGGPTKGFWNGAHEFGTLPSSPNGSGTFTQFTSTPGTEQFGFNLRDNVTFGFDPDGNGLVADLLNPDYATVNRFSYDDSGNTVPLAQKTSPNAAAARYTISYLANINPLTPGGTYTAHQVFVIVATY
jgi:hypothetical protein